MKTIYKLTQSSKNSHNYLSIALKLFNYQNLNLRKTDGDLPSRCHVMRRKLGLFTSNQNSFHKEERKKKKQTSNKR